MKAMYGPIAISLLTLTINSSAQTVVPPKNEYTLLASANTISIQRGQQDSLKISILRSRSFKTGTPVITASWPAPGIIVTVKPSSLPDIYVVHISATEEIEPGEYNVLPLCTLKNKTKGIVIRIIII